MVVDRSSRLLWSFAGVGLLAGVIGFAVAWIWTHALGWPPTPRPFVAMGIGLLAVSPLVVRIRNASGERAITLSRWGAFVAAMVAVWAVLALTT